MKKINGSLLKKGDIVLTTATGFKSAAIRFAMQSDISHAMVCVSNSSVMDSTAEGVHARNIQKMFYKDKSAIYILRLKEPISDDKLNLVINAIRKSTGTSYDVLDAARSVTIFKDEPSKNEFCSRLVARAFAEIGIFFSDDPDFCTPADLQRSPLLDSITPAAIACDEAEVEAWKGDDKTIDMRNITNQFLSKVREYDSKVETINQAVALSHVSGHMDKVVNGALEESGFLTFYKTEREKFPWRYDDLAAIQFQFANLRSPGFIQEMNNYCIATIEGHYSGEHDHWFACLEEYRSDERLQHSRTLKSLERLYTILTEGHLKRVELALNWLKLNNAQLFRRVG